MMTEAEVKELYQRILDLKMIELFEEPSTYEDDDEEKELN